MSKPKKATEVTVDNLSNLERRLTIVVPVEQIEEKEAAEFKKLSQQAQIKGYRKGKIPLPLLKQRFAKDVHEDVVRQMIDHSLTEALKNNELRPVSKINISSLEAAQGKPLKIEATFEISPEIKLVDVSKFELTKFKADISEEDINQKIEDLRKRHATWNPTQEPAQEGNQIKIDYAGEIDGKSFPGGSSDGVLIEIGKETMIPEFEKKLIGAKVGDLAFNVTFPKDYGIKELKGKKAHFKVKVHEVLVAELPPLDDNFAKKMDVSDGMEALRKKLKEFMEEELKQSIKENLKYQILEQLIEKHPMDIPKSMLESETKVLEERFKQQFAHLMKNVNAPEFDQEYFEKEARKKVAIGLIFSELVKKYDIKPDQQSIQKKIESMTSAYGVNADTLMKWLSGNEEARQQVTLAALEDQIIDKVLEQAQVKEKPASYQEAMQWKSEEK